MSAPIPNKLNTDDGNEEVCGACQKGGDLICCEECPAAFHCKCAGYSGEDDIPDGDWFCWFCAKQKNRTFHPVNAFEPPKNGRVRLAVDDTCEVFAECKRIDQDAEYITVQRAGQKQAPVERLSVRDPRLWHGTLDKLAWTSFDKLFRPNSRLYAIDKAKLAEILTNPEPQPPPPQPQPSSSKPRSSGPARSTGSADLAEGGDDDDIQPAPGVHLEFRDTSEEEFMEALDEFWSTRGGRKTTNYHQQELHPYILWQAIFQHGGPAQVRIRHQWAAISRMYPCMADAAPPALSNTPQRLYAATIKPFFKAILSGEVKFPIPAATKIAAKALKQSKATGITPKSSAARPASSNSGGKSSGSKRSAPPSSQGPASKKPAASLQTTPSSTSRFNGTEEAKYVDQVVPTDDAILLKVGDVVEFRSLGEGRKGGWFMGHITQVVEAPAVEGGRRLLVTYGKQCASYDGWKEWVPLVWRGSRSSPLPDPVVMVRRPSTNPPGHTPRLTEAVEAEKQGVWWLGRTAELHEKGFIRIQEMQSPYGEGHQWHVRLHDVRSVPANASSGQGMVTFPGPRITKSALVAKLHAELKRTAGDISHQYGVVLPPTPSGGSDQEAAPAGEEAQRKDGKYSVGGKDSGAKEAVADTGEGEADVNGEFVDVQDG